MAEAADNQVGGHSGALLFEGGYVYKPNTNPKELAFYTHSKATLPRSLAAHTDSQ